MGKRMRITDDCWTVEGKVYDSTDKIDGNKSHASENSKNSSKDAQDSDGNDTTFNWKANTAFVRFFAAFLFMVGMMTVET